MIKELIHRDGLLTALSGRDEHGLEPLVRFLFKHISNPSYSRLLIDIAELVLDMYAPVASQSIVVSELLHKLAAEVKEEIKAMVQMQRVLGLMDALLH